jgi:Protein of unknown function (DUF3738)
LTLRGCVLQMIIFRAYKVQDFQVLNAPDWATQERYSIEAVPPAIPLFTNFKPYDPKINPPDEIVYPLAALSRRSAYRMSFPIFRKTAPR